MSNLISIILHYASGKRFGVTARSDRKCEFEVSRERDDYDEKEDVIIRIEHPPIATDGSLSGYTMGQAKGDVEIITVTPTLARRLGEALLRASESEDQVFERFAAEPISVPSRCSKNSDFAIVEGKRGIIPPEYFDGADS